LVFWAFRIFSLVVKFITHRIYLRQDERSEHWRKLSFLYYNIVKRGPFVTKFCTNSIIDNVNKCCKFGYCMIFTFCMCTYIVTKLYVDTYGLVTIYAHTKSKNHTVTKFAAFVHVVYDTICTKFCNKRTKFDKAYSTKKLKKDLMCSYNICTVAHIKSRNHTKATFVAFVYVVCITVCGKFCSKRTTFDKVIVKKL